MAIDAHINEKFIVIQLQHLKFCCICPLGSVIDFIKPDDFLVIARNLISNLYLGTHWKDLSFACQTSQRKFFSQSAIFLKHFHPSLSRSPFSFA
jgi:hypothetical protein